MFIDLSGFTPLTESLMQRGTRGAEELSIILNEIFEPLVNLVYARGGFIPYFAGDAFTAIFPTAGAPITAMDYLQTAGLMRDLFADREFHFGEFQIGMKIGLSYGRVQWGVVGQQHRSFYFRGAPIDHCAECQTLASDEDIVFDQALLQLLDPIPFEYEEIEPGFFRLLDKISREGVKLVSANLPPLDEEVVRRFLPEAVADYDHEGEFRTVVTIFLSFSGIEDHHLLDRLATVVINQINNFSGYFKEIDFGDKGGVMVGFFGAPVSFENSIDRGLEFIYSLRDELRPLQEQSPLKYRIGATLGTAYTGFVGGQERCQYAAVGNRVNLAARLMTFADWGEVLVDSEIQKNRNFRFHHRGDIKYKGIDGNVPTFKLLGRSFQSRASFSGRMVGRDEEIKKLFDFSEPLFDGQPTGVAVIYGEAGIGKSRLIHEFNRALTIESVAEWHTCQADQILRKPFNPFLYFLKNYFGQSPDGTNADNRGKFELIFAELHEALDHANYREAPAIKRELQRTKPVLAALLGIHYPDSIWEQLDARGRYENTLQSIINLFLAESVLHPIVICIEDGHWIDENSRELLREFSRHFPRYPILLLITSRYTDDGARPELLSPAALTQLGAPRLEINLNILQPEAVRHMAESFLHDRISQEFYEQLLRATNGNPFYLEQLLEYFAERNLLVYEADAWTIKDKDIKLSGSINAILTARIDRLSKLVKETVKAAAVIGREFEVPVLSEVMRTQEEFSNSNGHSATLLREQIKTAEQGQIWQAMSELRYIFRHSLLREAAYSMQLRTRLQQLHQLIAEAIEKLYAGQLEERYVDLAFHYEQANVFDKTCEYLRKAADYARRNYQNQRALDYYEKLLQKLGDQTDVNRQIHTHLNRGRVLELIGKWDECEAAYTQALRLAKKSRDALLIGQANNHLGHLLMLRGNYPEAMKYLQTAVRLLESIDDRLGISKVYGNLGNLYFRQGDYDGARAHFEQSIELWQSSESPTFNAQVVANLGLTYMNQGQFDKGIRVITEQLGAARRQNDKQSLASLYTNLGIVHFEKGDYEKALDSYRRGLLLSEELGNKQLTSIAIGCIGSVYERQGNYDLAMEHFRRDLELCEELGDKQGIAIALGLIGELLSYRGEFHRAIEYLQKNLMLCEELGYQKGIAKAVNTLGDIFFYTQQYDRSLHYYNRAIEVTRAINNKLVLGFSLVEKGVVLVTLGQREALAPVVEEALALADALGNPDLLFEARLLQARAHILNDDNGPAITGLYALLSDDIFREQEAAVHFELARLLPERTDHRSKALVLYKALYNNTPKYLYRMRIEGLTES